MRINLTLSEASHIVPFNYQQKLVGAFHKWLGKNEVHDQASLYSLSWLQGGTASKEGLRFNRGATWFISSHDEALIKRVIKGILEDPAVCYGMSVVDVQIQSTPHFGYEERFLVASPVFIKRTIENREVHFSYEDAEAGNLLTETLKTKLKKAGLPETDVQVMFDPDYPNPKMKVVHYNKVGNKANLCPIIIKGDPKAIGFAWNVGVGNSTGICFGALI
jgi:CRISPR-associated endoribonuclease Cas6